MRFCLRAHHLQAQMVRRRFDAGARLWARLADVAEGNGLHERTITALYAAAVGHLRRTVYQRDEGLTRDQAIRDIQALKRLGLIQVAGGGRAKSSAVTTTVQYVNRRLAVRACRF